MSFSCDNFVNICRTQTDVVNKTYETGEPVCQLFQRYYVMCARACLIATALIRASVKYI